MDFKTVGPTEVCPLHYESITSTYRGTATLCYRDSGRIESGSCSKNKRGTTHSGMP
jgi:hypothetical protein